MNMGVCLKCREAAYYKNTGKEIADAGQRDFIQEWNIGKRVWCHVFSFALIATYETSKGWIDTESGPPKGCPFMFQHAVADGMTKNEK